MISPDNSADSSEAGPGQGTDNPKRVAVYDVDAGEPGTGSVIIWFGKEYDTGACWIFANDDSLFDLELME